jgi:hypothetical protein
MFSCYLKMERRQSLKKDGTEGITPRYVVTANAGYFKPLQAIESPNGDVVMYHQRNEKCNPNSTAETRLQCKGSVNFSSVYLEDLKVGETLIGYGEPPQNEMLKPKKGKNGKLIERPNPFYDNRADGYLFVMSPDFNTIEILIVPNGRQLIRGYTAMLADGQLNEELEQVRKSAFPRARV